MSFNTSKLKQIGSAAVIYLGAAWGVLEASSFLFQKYGIQEGYQDLLIILIAIAFPIVVIYNGLENPTGKFALITYFVILVVGGYFINHSLQKFNTHRLSKPDITKESKLGRIAVMPIVNLTGQDSIDYLIHGIHESLTNELGQLKLFDVISNRTTDKFSGVQASIIEINNQLNVDAIVEASVLGSGDSIRVSVRLTETKTENQLWSGNFNYATKNILALYSEVSKTIAHAINNEFNPSSYVEQISYNPEAIRSYYKGMEHWDKLTPEELNLSMRYFEKAVSLDKTFPGGYVGIAIAWAGLAQMQQIPYNEVAKNGFPHLEKALQLDSANAQVLFTKATVNGWWLWNWEKGENDFKKTLYVNPSNSDAMSVYSHFLIAQGRNEEAIHQIKRALDIDPLNTRFIGYYAMILNFNRQYKEAEELLTDARGKLIDTGLTESTLQTTYHMLKQYDKAIDMWIQLYGKKNDSQAVELIRSTYISKGYEATLIALANMFIKRGEEQKIYVSPWSIATKLLRGGDYERSLDWLEKAYREHNLNMPYIHIDPIFDPVRENPRFIAIHTAMEFPATK